MLPYIVYGTFGESGMSPRELIQILKNGREKGRGRPSMMP
jgi:hypothetical protein